jgi:dynein heavy chain
MEEGIKVIKLSSEGLLKNVENAVRQGIPLLIEDVGEQLDNVLEPLLLK